jgi:hypothetical protein
VIPRYPFVVVIHYKAEVKRGSVSRQFDTLAAAFAMRDANIGRRDVHKIVVGLELDVVEGTNIINMRRKPTLSE